MDLLSPTKKQQSGKKAPKQDFNKNTNHDYKTSRSSVIYFQTIFEDISELPLNGYKAKRDGKIRFKKVCSTRKIP